MALAYLLCPTFQIENTAGKPATGGYLEVYVAGSRNKYYCASDFNGTLHPFRIELDSLGSNVVLADDSNAYDVYVYNRYGSLLMSRYGVKPGGGGGISSTTITSTDGSIVVTPTATGVDLRVDSEPPTSMRCSANDLQESDTFEFTEVQRNGADASVNNNGQVVVNSGWWHYDVVVRLKWPANPAENVTSSISLYSPNGSSSSYFDRSYVHDETLQLSGEYKSVQDGTVFPVSIQGVPSGMTVELVDFGIHSVTGEGGGGGTYNGGEGILIDEADRVISIDPEVVQEKLTAGNNITIEDNVISAAAEPQVQSDWTQSDSTAVDYIQHKPDLSLYVTDSELDTILEGYATTTALSTGLAAKQDVISDLAAIRSGAAAGATAIQPGDLATVATTGSYNDLLDKPTIPTVPVQDVEVNGASVVNAQGVAEITIDTGAFVAVYGSTTMAQVTAAYDSGKDIVCRYNDGRGRVYSGQLSSFAYGVYTFSTTDGFTEYDFTLSPNGADGAWAISSKAIPSVDSSYNASSYAAQSGVAVAQAVAGVNAVPVSTTSDEDKVLTVNSQGEPEWDVLPVSTPEVFIAQYNVTTWSAIREAYVDGKVILLRVHAIPGQVPPIENEGELYLLDKIFESNVPTRTIARFYSGTSGATQGSLQKTVWSEYWVDGNDVWHHEARYALPYVNIEGKVLTSHSTGSVSFEDPVTQTVDQTYDGTSSNAQSGTAVAGALASYTPTASLSTVALTGDYDDLSNKPSIPVIGTITL